MPKNPLVDGTVRNWVIRCEHGLAPFLPLHAPIGKKEVLSREETITITELSTACMRATQSVLILVEHQKLWDADVVARSLIEASVKFIYLLSDREMYVDRFREYRCDLFEIGLLRNHHKASSFLQTVENPDGPEWQPIRDLILDEQELIEFRTKYPRDIQKRLEQKWGFTQLISDLQKSGKVKSIAMLLHSYSISSHIMHADWQGVSIVMERERRPDDRRIAIHLAHAARLLNELIAFSFLRLLVAYRFLEIDNTSIGKAYESSSALRAEFMSVDDHFIQTEYPPPNPA